MAFGSDSEIRIVITADANKAVAGFNQASLSTGKLAGAFAVGQIAAQAIMKAISALTDAVVDYAKESLKYAIDLETAWTGVRKVYDGTASDIENVLMPAASELTTLFGQEKLAVIEVMDSFAAMGKVGQENIDMTRRALEFATVGALDHAAAMDTVTAVSSIYKVKGQELVEMLSTLNTVENLGAVSMGELGIAIAESGGVAKEMGVDIYEFASAINVLKENGVDAGEAANGLKTVFIKLRQPSDDLKEIYKKLNIQIKDSHGNLLDSDVILKKVAQKWDRLTEAEKQTFAVQAGGLFQVSKLSVLMADLTDEQSRYYSVLNDSKPVLADVNTLTEQGRFLAEEAGVDFAKLTTNQVRYFNETAIALGTTEVKVRQFKAAFDEIKEVVGTELKKSFDDLLAGLQPIITDALPKITAGIKTAFATLRKDIGDVVADIKPHFEETRKSAYEAFKSLNESGVLGQFLQTLSTIKETGKELVAIPINTMLDVMRKILDGFKEHPERLQRILVAINVIVEAIKAWQKIQWAVIGWLITAIADVLGWLMDAGVAIGDFVNELLGLQTPTEMLNEMSEGMEANVVQLEEWQGALTDTSEITATAMGDMTTVSSAYFGTMDDFYQSAIESQGHLQGETRETTEMIMGQEMKMIEVFDQATQTWQGYTTAGLAGSQDLVKAYNEATRAELNWTMNQSQAAIYTKINTQKVEMAYQDQVRLVNLALQQGEWTAKQVYDRMLANGESFLKAYGAVTGDYSKTIGANIMEIATNFSSVANSMVSSKNRIVSTLGDLALKANLKISPLIEKLKKLSPFHRSSPSLIDNITRGVGIIQRQYGRLAQIGIGQPNVMGMTAGSRAANTYNQQRSVSVGSIVVNGNNMPTGAQQNALYGSLYQAAYRL